MPALNPGLGPVWASPLSLATTDGIAFAFFSSGYLDVSVPRVASCPLRDQVTHNVRRVSPFGDPGVDGCIRLAPAYRR